MSAMSSGASSNVWGRISVAKPNNSPASSDSPIRPRAANSSAIAPMVTAVEVISDAATPA